MEFAVLSRIAAIFLSPGNILVGAALVGGALLFIRPNAGRILLLLVAAAEIIIAALPLAAWMARPLEDRFPRRPLSDHIQGILVLSGGPNATVFIARGVPAPDSAEGRLLAAADLARRHPEAKVVFSGGIAPVIGGAVPETVVARSIFAQMGIPPNRVIWEDRGRSTWENFTYSKALVQPRPGDVWVVVTSALNMPRAMAIAERVCWPMQAWPSDYISTGGQERLSSLDFAARLLALGMVTHEWLGLAAYYITGRAGACIR